MRIKEMHNWLQLLRDLGHKVREEYMEKVEGEKARRHYVIDEAWHVVVKGGNVSKPRRLDKD